MEVKYTAEKFKIFENILAVNNKKMLFQLQYLITNFISENEIINVENKEIDNISFEEWNKQFTNERDLNDFIPEYGMTVGNFRNQIYEAEFGNSMSLNEFENKVSQWKTKHAR